MFLLKYFDMAKRKNQLKKRKISAQGVYGMNANKSKILPVKSTSDIATKVKSIIVK